MAAWRYEISILVLKKYFTSERSERVKYFLTLEEKFRISARPCNILYLFFTRRGLPQANYFKRSLIGFVFSNDPKSEKKAKSTTKNASPVVHVAGLWMLLLKSYKAKGLF